MMDEIPLDQSNSLSHRSAVCITLRPRDALCKAVRRGLFVRDKIEQSGPAYATRENKNLCKKQRGKIYPDIEGSGSPFIG